MCPRLDVPSQFSAQPLDGQSLRAPSSPCLPLGSVSCCPPVLTHAAPFNGYDEVNISAQVKGSLRSRLTMGSGLKEQSVVLIAALGWVQVFNPNLTDEA